MFLIWKYLREQSINNLNLGAVGVFVFGNARLTDN